MGLESSAPIRVLVVDDEADMLRICSDVLSSGFESHSSGARVDTDNTAAEARRLLLRATFELVILDIKMPGVSGLELMHFALEHAHRASVVLITAYPDYGDAVSAIKEGAFDYLVKPFTAGKLIQVARNAVKERRPEESPAKGKSPAGPLDELLGESARMCELREMIARVSGLRENVVLLGETGTGKGLCARILHEVGPLRDRPMITFDCGAVPAELIESELFGHHKGSFTGAHRDRKGILELAADGTLLLDEVTELPLRLQSRLLRALQERVFRRIGGSEVKPVRARMLAASNRDLRREVHEGRFREDLFFRLNVIPISIPPLREHSEDIRLLTETFLRRFREQNPESRVCGTSRAALRRLERYRWPGNVRELQNVIRRSSALCPGEEIVVEDLPEEILMEPWPRENPAFTGFAMARDQWLSRFEERYFRDLLEQTGGNVVAAARSSGVPRPSLYRYLRKHALDPSKFRGSRARQCLERETRD